METKTIVTFICGCLLTFLGVWITSSRPQTDDIEESNSTITASERFRQTVGTVLTETTPFLSEIVPSPRPRALNRMPSSNAQSGPLVTYFVSKAESNRQRNLYNRDLYSSSFNNTLQVPASDSALHSTSI